MVSLSCFKFSSSNDEDTGCFVCRRKEPRKESDDSESLHRLSQFEPMPPDVPEEVRSQAWQYAREAFDDVVPIMVKMDDLKDFATSNNGLNMSAEDADQIIEGENHSTVDDICRALLQHWDNLNTDADKKSASALRRLVRGYNASGDQKQFTDAFEDDVIVEFSTFGEFKSFALSAKGLKMSESEIEDILTNTEFTDNEKKLQIMFRWKENYGSKTSVKDVKQMAIRFRNMLDKPSGKLTSAVATQVFPPGTQELRNLLQRKLPKLRSSKDLDDIIAQLKQHRVYTTDHLREMPVEELKTLTLHRLQRKKMKNMIKKLQKRKAKDLKSQTNKTTLARVEEGDDGSDSDDKPGPSSHLMVTKVLDGTSPKPPGSLTVTKVFANHEKPISSGGGLTVTKVSGNTRPSAPPSSSKRWPKVFTAMKIKRKK